MRVLLSTGPILTPSPFGKLMKHMFDRINTASGPYQMVAVLGDGVVFRCGTRTEEEEDEDDGSGSGDGAGAGGRHANVRAEYLEEVTSEYMNAQFSALPRLFWSFGYEKQRQSLHDSRRFGTLFQVHLWWFPGNCAATKDQHTLPDGAPIVERLVQKEVLRLSEDLNTNWGAYETRRRVGEWLYTKVTGLERPLRAAVAAKDGAQHAGSGKGASGRGGGSDREAGSVTNLPTTIPEILLQVQETKTLLASLDAAKQSACGADQENDACKTALVEQAAAQTKAAALVRAFRSAHASAMPTVQVALPDSGKGGPSAAIDPESSHDQAQAKAATAGVNDERARGIANGVDTAPIEDGQGIVAWDEPAAWLLGCLDKTEQRAGGTVPKSHAEKCAKCAIDLGRQWQGGRVEANTVNYGNATVSLWQGSVLHFEPPMMLARALLLPGESKHFLTHEGEVWQMRDGANNVLRDWVVDVSNGVVQDLVLRPADVTAAYARVGGRQGTNVGEALGVQQPASVGTVAAKTSLQFFDGVFEGFNNFMQDLSM